MWKVVCVVLVLVAPSFGGPIAGRDRATSIRRSLLDFWRKKCDVSSIGYNTIEQLYMDYENCTETALDKNEWEQVVESVILDLRVSKWGLVDLFNVDYVAVSMEYCPKLEACSNCRDILLPILRQCFNSDELGGESVNNQLYRYWNNFFCKNESDGMKRVIGGKVLECAMEKEAAVRECYKVYQDSFFNENTPVSILIPFPKGDFICRSFESFGRCLDPLFSQCTMSQSAADIVRSVFGYVIEATECQRHLNSTQESNIHQILAVTIPNE